ncbi:MAG: YbaB/EbfC family nucleoid-associated protein [Planctomycetota bacterium]|jgi:DNA-binding YbaB/EbfC family protein|nr:YbaB/EbfC family nucleoid-associated protein [Planctomycetota bacterium]
MFKQFSDMFSMMGQFRKMGEINEKLKEQKTVGSSGGGMVEVEVNGLGEVLEIRIDDSVIADKEMLLDLLPSAINQAAAKAKQLSVEMMTDGMNIPGLDDAISQMSTGRNS